MLTSHNFVILEFEDNLLFEDRVDTFLFILFKPTHALFLNHIYIHIQNSKLLKMFVKHIN
jgi:hypothetical protein